MVSFGRGCGFGGRASQKAIDPSRIAPLAKAASAGRLGDRRRRAVRLLLGLPRVIAAR
jgi:hypothetical protein